MEFTSVETRNLQAFLEGVKLEARRVVTTANVGLKAITAENTPIIPMVLGNLRDRSERLVEVTEEAVKLIATMEHEADISLLDQQIPQDCDSVTEKSDEPIDKPA